MIAVNAVAVIAYLLFTWYLLRTYREHFVLFFYFSFMLTWALISCFYNDLGIYNIELFRITETTYATARLAGFYIVFNLGFFFMARLLKGKPLARTDYRLSRQTLRLGHLKFSVYSAVGFMIIYIAYKFVTDGIPLFSGINRLEYFREAGFLEQKLIFYAIPIAFILGYFRRKRGRLSANGLIIAAFILFAVLIGNKFSLLLGMLVYYFFPIFVGYQAEHPRLRLLSLRQVLAVTSLIVLLLMISFAAYFNVFKDISHAYNLLVNRVFAFQGEMWWAVDNDIARHGRYDPDHWQVELNNILSPGDIEDGQVGMKYLMVKAIGPEKAFPIFQRGYLYTMTYPAILIATFRYPVALVIQFLVGMVFFAMLYYFYYSIRYRHALRSIFMMLVFLPYTVALVSGNFATFFTPGMALKILILLLLELGAGRARTSTAES